MFLGKQIHAAFHRPSTAICQRVSGFVWLLIVLSIVLLVAELTVLEPQREVLYAADRVILVFFGVELALRVLSYHPPELDFWRLSPGGRLKVHVLGRLRYCLTPLVLIDALTVLGSVPVLRGLRALRLLRLLRSRRILRYANPFEGIARAFEENRLLYVFGLSVFGTSVLLGGLSFYLAEHTQNDDIASIADGMWWSIVTITTVGYGDLTPVTTVGRIVAGTMMVVGMVTLALFAGIVGSTLMGTVLSVREESFRMSHYIDHVVICGYEPGARMLLDTISEELDHDKHTVVIFAPGERPSDVPMEFLWVQGDPTKESELDKIRITYADAVIIVGSRQELPQLADARTILVTFTLRRYLKRHQDSLQRQKPLYIVTEILDAENVEHAKTAGADEVIETTRMGFSLLAHAVEVHGTATLVGELADVSGNSLFVGRVPPDLEGPHTVGSVRKQLKERLDVLMIGLREADGSDQLNPPDDTPMTSACRAIYVARRPVLPA